MTSFLDLFGLRRRSYPRVRVAWTVDVKTPEWEGYVGFDAVEIGRDGVRLVGRQMPAIAGRLTAGEPVEMRLRLPPPLRSVDAEAELRWFREEGNHLQLGCRFTRIPREARQAIEEYVAAHPGDIVEGEE